MTTNALTPRQWRAFLVHVLAWAVLVSIALWNTGYVTTP